MKRAICKNCRERIVKWSDDDFWSHESTSLYGCYQDTTGTVAEPEEW